MSSPKKIILKTACFLAVLFLSIDSYAHVIVNELENMSRTETSLIYFKLGFTHIIPLGFDHILFILGLFLSSPRLKPLLVQATAFTIAHTVTLGLSMYEIIKPPASVIEPAIAISIMFVAVQNILFKKPVKSRVWVVFLFGMVHGMGFASALQEIGLPQNAYIPSLIMFNAGVEIGQICVIISAFLIFGWFGSKEFYRRWLVIPASAMIAVMAGYMTIERLFI